MNRLSCRATIIAACFILLGAYPAASQGTGTPVVRIQDKPDESRNEILRASGGTYDLAFIVDRDPNNRVKKVFVRTDNGIGTNTSFLDVDPNIEKYEVEVKLFEEENTITVYTALDGSHPDRGSEDKIKVTCRGSKCIQSGAAAGVTIIKGGATGSSEPRRSENPPQNPGTAQPPSSAREGAGQSGDKPVTILKPEKNATVYNESEVLVKFGLSPAARGKKKVGQKEEADPAAKPESLIREVYVTATSPNKATRQVKIPVNVESQEQSQLVAIAKGRNTITVSNANEVVANPASDSVEIECIGETCGGAETQSSGSSLYTRAILGFQQSGVSAGASEQKPFVDFFFGAPVGKDFNNVPPLVSLWGNVRLTSLPQQVLAANTAINNFGGNFSLSALEGTQVNDIVQGFEFLAGVDVRLLPTSQQQQGTFGLFPGVREKSSLSLVVSGGAINPFRQRNAVQFFGVPRTTSGQIDESALLQISGLTAADLEGKTNIAFVAPERDRFLRQYYAGLRLKTFFYDRNGEAINRFPAMLDMQFGRNESVTGNLKKNVFRLEGFFPLPFRETSFLYLFGTATMKLGDSGARTFLPLILPPATGNPNLSDPSTLVISINRAESLRSTRDYYQFGLGINLFELFNRRPTSSR